MNLQTTLYTQIQRELSAEESSQRVPRQRQDRQCKEMRASRDRKEKKKNKTITDKKPRSNKNKINTI